MSMWWIGIGAAAVAAGVVVRMGRRPDPTEELSKIVLKAFGPDWTQRFETGEPAVRRAVLDDLEPELQARIAGAIGVVDVKFAQSPSRQRIVSVVALCDYPAAQEQSRVTFDLDWVDTPADVREEFLRTGRTEVFRKWAAAVTAPEAAR
jgi:hypothetical protein